MGFPAPEIGVARRDFSIPLESGEEIEGYLRSADDGHEFAYTRSPKLPVVLPNGRGKIIYGQVYQRLNLPEPTYRATQELVVIKKLSKAALRRDALHAENEGRINSENPQNEISASQLLGNNDNVIAMQEALEGPNFLYMIMPFFGSDLLDALQAGRTRGQQPNVPRLLRTLVGNLSYLEEHGVLHRDLSPENIIVHSEHSEDCCPLIDLAMALRCTELEGNILPIQPQHPCGKLPYMSPEVARQEPLTSKIDVWAIGVTLFLIWTHKRLYEQPFDRCWKYFLRDGGLENDRFDLFPQWQTINDVPEDYLPVIEKLKAVQNLSQSQRRLLAEMLRLDPNNRIRSGDILNRGWYQEPEQQQQL